MILASCGSENTENNNQQAQIDSVAAANAALQDELNKKKNDSAINAIATAKADSITAAEAAANAIKSGSLRESAQQFGASKAMNVGGKMIANPINKLPE